MNPQEYIKKPCHENWNTMSGNERKKFCDRCSCSVHNLTDMNHKQIMDLYSDLGGKLCGVFHQSCEQDTALIEKKKIRRIHLRKSMALGVSISTLALAACQTENNDTQTTDTTPPVNQSSNTNTPVETKRPDFIMGKIKQEEKVEPIKPPKHPEMLMGDVCPPENPKR